MAAKREAEFSLPLREIDVLVNNLRTEAGVFDQSSQIVVIREDLAKEVGPGAKINTQCTLRMEGANSMSVPSDVQKMSTCALVICPSQFTLTSLTQLPLYSS